MSRLDDFLTEHRRLTRRYMLHAGASAAAIGLWPFCARAEQPPELQRALAELESYLTRQDDFRDVSRGQPLPHTLPEEKKRSVGMTRETWKLEVVSDPDHPADIRNPMTREKGNAFDFTALMELARTKAVRFPKVMTCLNIGCPLGMGIWEGVPLREVFWQAVPRKDVRRVFYYGYHNDRPEQMFRSSLPVDRVLEDRGDLPPVILCYKLNGDWLTSQRGGPVRVVVPEAYGFKSIKWLERLVLTNLYHANDSYADGNNDVDSALKTFAATLSVPSRVKAGDPIPVTGYAQVGISGLAKVQVWIHADAKRLLQGDKYFTRAPWTDATILPPPADWGGELPHDKIPQPTLGFDRQTGQPQRWPLQLAKVHWAALLPGLPDGEYTLRCRTIDQQGNAQPMPRPFRKSGHAAIEQKPVVVHS